jgi:hypothetical protein
LFRFKNNGGVPRFRAEDEANKQKIEAKNGLEMLGTRKNKQVLRNCG